MNRLRRVRHDQSGMSYVFIGMGMMAFLSATLLAIDVGMLMTSRSQAQNSADAGALAGATALVFNSYTDRTTGGPVVTGARNAAQANKVMATSVSVLPSDVTFPPNPGTGMFNRVKVDVFRTTARGNPVSTLMAKVFGINTADIGATATAEASPANAMACVKPFTIPDKWTEKQTPGWDMNDTFEIYDQHGNPLPNKDIYVPAGQPGYTGYSMIADKGQLLMIRAGTGNNINAELLFFDRDRRHHRRPGVSLEYRQLQHHDDALRRSVGHGAWQHERTDGVGCAGSVQRGSDRVLGHQLPMPQEPDEEEPASIPDPDLRPGLLG